METNHSSPLPQSSSIKSFDFMYIVRVLDMQVPEEDKKRAPSLYNLVS